MKVKKRGIQVAEAVKKKGLKFVDFFKKSAAFLSGLVSIIFTLFLAVFFISLFMPSDGILSSGNIAVIPITGLIAESAQGIFGAEITTPSKLIELIKKANESKNIKGIVFEINSPGGSPVASDDIASAIKEITKPKIAVIKEAGASGAYWIATASDRIFANKMSLTGSIGVTSSRLEYAGLLNRYNVTYRRLVSGELKDAGSPYREMTEKERELFQKLLGKIHEYFIKEVAQNRKLSVEKVKELADGFVYLGEEAKELGLVDELGSRKDAVKYLEKQLNITAEVSEFKAKKTLFDVLGAKFEALFYYAGKGFGSAIVEEGITNRLEVIT